MKFARPFSTFSALFKEAAAKATKAAKTPNTKDAPKKLAKAPYKRTKEDLFKHGKLNKGEQKRLFDTDAETLNMDRVKLLRRHVQYQTKRDRLSPYAAWMKAQAKATPGSRIGVFSAKYSKMSDAEKAEINREYTYDANATNEYDKFDYKSIKVPKLSGLNLFLRAALKDQPRVVEENKLKDAITEWNALSASEKQHYMDQAKKENAGNTVRLQKIYKQVKELYEKEAL